MKSCTLFLIAILAVTVWQFSPATCLQNEYNPYDEESNKIIGLRHFEDFLRDLEKKVAEWTRRFRDSIAQSRPTVRLPRQASSELDVPPGRPVQEWIVVKDIIEGAKFARKQISDFLERVTRVITGDRLYLQANGNMGPYVPVVKELREFLVLLQRRITAWSNELERVFTRPTSDYPAVKEITDQNQI